MADLQSAANLQRDFSLKLQWPLRELALLDPASLFLLFFHKFTANRLSFSAEILGFCAIESRNNSEIRRCFPLFLAQKYKEPLWHGSSDEGHRLSRSAEAIALGSDFGALLVKYARPQHTTFHNHCQYR